MLQHRIIAVIDPPGHRRTTLYVSFLNGLSGRRVEINSAGSRSVYHPRFAVIATLRFTHESQLTVRTAFFVSELENESIAQMHGAKP